MQLVKVTAMDARALDMALCRMPVLLAMCAKVANGHIFCLSIIVRRPISNLLTMSGIMCLVMCFRFSLGGRSEVRNAREVRLASGIHRQ